MTQCLKCDKLDLQGNRAMAKLGMGHCPHDPNSVFVSVKFERVCKLFKPAPAATVAARETWAKKL